MSLLTELHLDRLGNNNMFLDTPVDDLRLLDTTRNKLLKNGISDARGIAKYTQKELMAMGLLNLSVSYLEKCLRREGIYLK